MGGRAGMMAKRSSAGPPLTVVKKALEAQNERFNEKIAGKDDMIQRQQNVMIKQREQILKLQEMQQEF